MADENDDGSVTHSFSFSVGPGELRNVNDDAVEAFDEALEGAGTGGVNHFIDPRRLQTFEAGGPSVWSVATVQTDAGTLYLSYGFSGAIDPARGECDFEMSVLVPFGRHLLVHDTDPDKRDRRARARRCNRVSQRGRHADRHRAPRPRAPRELLAGRRRPGGELGLHVTAFPPDVRRGVIRWCVGAIGR